MGVRFSGPLFQSWGAFNIFLSPGMGRSQMAPGRTPGQEGFEAAGLRPKLEWEGRSTGLAGAGREDAHAPACVCSWAVDTAGQQGLFPQYSLAL